MGWLFACLGQLWFRDQLQSVRADTDNHCHGEGLLARGNDILFASFPLRWFCSIIEKLMQGGAPRSGDPFSPGEANPPAAVYEKSTGTFRAGFLCPVARKALTCRRFQPPFSASAGWAGHRDTGFRTRRSRCIRRRIYPGRYSDRKPNPSDYSGYNTPQTAVRNRY